MSAVGQGLRYVGIGGERQATRRRPADATPDDARETSTTRTPRSVSAARLVVPELLLSWQDVLRVVDKTVVDLPSRLLENAGVVSGDLVWVLSLVVGSTALVEVVRAKTTWLPDAPAALRWALYEGDSGDDDEVAAAARYEQGPAARPDITYVQSVLRAARSGDLPTHQLRLAG